jgi:protein O-GlcNAc transferase
VLLAQPNNHSALHLAGVVAHEKKDPNTALQLIQKSIAVEPKIAGYYNNLGEVYRSVGDFESAENAYRTAMKMQPMLADAEANLGLCLAAQDKWHDAITCYQSAIALNPKLPHPYNSLGVAYAKLGRLDDAIDSYRKAVAIDPNYAQAQSNLLLALNYHPTLSRNENFEAHRAWGTRLAGLFAAAVKPYVNDRTPERRIRIAYLSPDFRRHSVSYFLEPLLASHDHNKVHVTCYSDVLAPDDVTKRIKRSADSWRDVAPLTHTQLADLIRNDEIDILVDTTGHTANNRMALFAMKPAPIQVSVFGYPATTGLPTMDYRITDSKSDEAGADAYYAEKLLKLNRLAWCWQPSPEAPPVAPLPADKNGFVTFGSFNNVYKVTKDFAKVWADILAAVPESKLLVLVAPGSEHEYVRNLFMSSGVPPARLQLEPKRPRREYLELIGTTDIALDPFPYNGGVTTCECLYQGTPVVSQKGDTYVARQGYAILSSIDLSELAASSREDYVQITVNLAKDRLRLRDLRGSMRKRMTAFPLMDAVGYARELETTFREIWKSWCATGT